MNDIGLYNLILLIIPVILKILRLWVIGPQPVRPNPCMNLPTAGRAATDQTPVERLERKQRQPFRKFHFKNILCDY